MNPALMLLMQARAASSWTPASLGAALFAWYDPSDTSTITHGSGVVSELGDKSGNARHLKQTSPGSRPSTGTRTINSLNVIDYNNWERFLSAASLTIPSPVTVAAISAHDALKKDSGCVVALGGTVGYTPRARCSADTGGEGWSIKGSVTLSQSSAITLGAPYLTTAVLNGASSLLRVNRTQVISGDAGTYTGDRILLASAGVAGSAYGIDGQIGEVVVVSGALTGTDLSSLEAYLSAKWGIA